MANSKLLADEEVLFSAKDVLGGRTEGRILLEVDIKALQRLLKCKSISVCEFRGVSNTSKQCVKSLYLDLLNRELAVCTIKA